MEDRIKNKLLEFIRYHLKYNNRQLLDRYILEHEKYGTMDYAIDMEGNVVGFVRWNMSDNNTCGNILDLAIDKKWRNKCIGRDFIIRALKKFPNVRTIRFMRGIRGDERIKELTIKEILKRKIL